jgi:uncharacterized protein YjbI with pentapeptide repeats
MGKRKVEGPGEWLKPRFQGKTFAFAGDVRKYDRERLETILAGEGGQQVKEVSATLDFLVVLDGPAHAPTGAEKKAEQLNRKGASIQTITEAGILDRCTPTAEEALALLRAGAGGIERWNALRGYREARELPLRGADLRGGKLAGVRLWNGKLNRIDFREADLTGAMLKDLSGSRLDGANLTGASLFGVSKCSFDGACLQGASLSSKITGCSFTGADLAGAHSGGSYLDQWRGCDCTGAEMQGFHGNNSTFADVAFRNADLNKAGLADASFSGCDCRAADLRGADLSNASLAGVNLAEARLGQALLVGAKLVKADLRKADLRGANLTNADLRGAKVDGANFEGAVLTGAQLADVNLKKAVGLAQTPPRRGGKLGPCVRRLEEAVRECNGQFEFLVEVPEGLVDLSFRFHTGGQNSYANVELGEKWTSHFCYSLRDALGHEIPKWAHGTFRPESVSVQVPRCALAGEELRRRVIDACCEVFGVDPPTPAELAGKDAAYKAWKAELREQALEELRGGPQGVARWNARARPEKGRPGGFAGADLVGARLKGADLRCQDFSGANLAGADLTEALLPHADFRKARLPEAVLHKADCRSAKFQSADLRGADFTGCRAGGCSLRQAGVQRADFTGADLAEADLCDVDLSVANLTGVALAGAKYDARTRFPAGFVLPEGMRWAGKGTNPHLAGEAVRLAAPLDLPAFLTRLRESTAAGRLDNALKMLCAGAFRLYVRAEADCLTGVVKSQTDPALLYSCRLASDGSFACCTQKLNPCGGLRGALCKHLLVLIVGLARAGQVDLAKVDAWVRVSRKQQPALDRELMSDTFLRYQGAEAGRIDWRPTETIPEDYYAL